MILQKDKYSFANYAIYVVACSVMGEGKIENQDSVEIRKMNNGLIVAVADGLGSASYSKEGSQQAVKIVADLLIADDFTNFPEKLVKQWKEKLEGNIYQYDTTIKFIYLKDDKVVVGGIGDGWIALKGKNEVESFTVKSEFSNQTDSILSIDIKNKFWFKQLKLEEYNSMIIATDGFSEDINKESGYEFLKQVEEEIIRDINGFSMDLDNTISNWPVETNKDDKTVVFIVIRKNSKEGVYE